MAGESPQVDYDRKAAGASLWEKANYIFRRIFSRLDTLENRPVPTSSGGGVSDHALLTHLTYASSGHTGFAPTAHTHAEADVTGLVTDLAAKVSTARLISTTAPLTGGGDLSADRTLAISQGTGSGLDADKLDGYHASGLGAVIDHGSLQDLGADDHAQYLPVSGSRAMDGHLGPKVVALVDAANIVTDASLGNHFRVTLTANRIYDNPTGAYDGQILRIEFKQDGTGGWTLAWGGHIIKPYNVPAIVLSIDPNTTDMMQLVYNSSEDLYVITGFLNNIYGV
jgi:hypothetical protein